MAGHSQFKNIMHRKGAQDAKRAKLFTKILREITVSAKAGGPDPDTNPRLRVALMNAKQANVSKDTIERALHKSYEESDAMETLFYEGFGPNHAAIIIETMTDNRNRTACDIRGILHKYGGRLADVQFLFKQRGQIVYNTPSHLEKMMDVALQYGADDFLEEEHFTTILCQKEDFFVLRDALEQTFQEPIIARLGWIPITPVTLCEDKEIMAKFIHTLDEHDDVQSVWTCYDWRVENAFNEL